MADSRKEWKMSEKKQNAQKKWKTLIWSVIKADILSLAFYLVFFNLINALLYMDVPQEERNFALLYCALAVIYAIVFYFVHIRKHSEEYVMMNQDAAFHWRSDLRAYMAGEGKQLLILYGVLAVIMEISMLAFPTRNPIGTVLLMVFPMVGVIRIPILRCLLSWAVTVLFALLLTVWGHRRCFLYWHRENRK